MVIMFYLRAYVLFTSKHVQMHLLVCNNLTVVKILGKIYNEQGRKF